LDVLNNTTRPTGYKKAPHFCEAFCSPFPALAGRPSD
jgi:hypothetical protein